MQDRTSFVKPNGKTGPTMAKLGSSTTYDFTPISSQVCSVRGRTCFDSTLSAFPTFSASVLVQGQGLMLGTACCFALPRFGHTSWSCYRQTGPVRSASRLPTSTPRTPDCTTGSRLVPEHRLVSNLLSASYIFLEGPRPSQDEKRHQSTASHFEHYQESVCVSMITMAPLQPLCPSSTRLQTSSATVSPLGANVPMAA